MKTLYIEGMHGLGDNLHQRAIIKSLYKNNKIYLETSWPQIYWDFPDIRFVAKGTNLRTQVKNQLNNLGYFENTPDNFDNKIKIFYKPEDIRSQGSVLGAMLKPLNIENDDFSFKPKEKWIESANSLVNTDKPILIYRPLVCRKEWGGCDARNPNAGAYKTILESFKDRFFVISIADLKQGVEWESGHHIRADLHFDEGELSFEQIAGLFHLSSLVYCSPGFSAVLARSMGKPLITIFGGYENGSSFSKGYGEYIPIDTVSPCSCFSHRHNCNKNIDLQSAITKVREFIDAQIAKS